MQIFKQFYDGVKSYGKAIELVFSSNLWVYFLYPVIMYILIYVIGIFFLNNLASKISSFILELFHSYSSSYIYNLFHRYFYFIISLFLKIFLWFVISTISKYIVLILMSPVMAVLSMRTEMLLTGNKYTMSGSEYFRNIARGIVIVLRNMFLQVCLLALMIFVFWIPVVGWLFPFLILIISYYFYGFSMIDYVNERRSRRVSQSINYVRRNKGLAIGNGFIFTLLINIPIVGIIIATVLSPVAACIAVVEVEQKTQLKV